MKEEKVFLPKLGLRNHSEKLEVILNQYSREDWVVNHIAQSAYMIVFERDKNR